LVYSIAAYTITIGTLALYGILIQYRSRVAAAALADARGMTASDPRKGFNLGASLLAPFWMWMHGLRVPAVIVFALGLGVVPLYQREMWIPMLLVAMIPAAAAAAAGFGGNRIAAEYRGREKPAQFAASQLPWALLGAVIFTVILPWALYFLGVIGPV